MESQKGPKIGDMLFAFDNFDEQCFDIGYFGMSGTTAFEGSGEQEVNRYGINQVEKGAIENNNGIMVAHFGQRVLVKSLGMQYHKKEGSLSE